LAVGLRQKALRQRFLISNDGLQSFPQPAHIEIDP